MLKNIENPDAVHRNLKGFTIIELLTVMTIIILLMAVLVPGLNRIRKLAKDVTQRSQFYDIDKALSDYRNDHQDEYPDSNFLDYDPAGRKPYCGAMKLCEALVGQDGMGNHAESRLMSVPLPDSEGLTMYPFDLCTRIDPSSPLFTDTHRRSIKKRTRYLENLNIRPVWLSMLYGTARANLYSTFGVKAVLTDVYKRTTIDSTVCAALSSEKVGMPILYYKADVRKSSLDANDCITGQENSDNIYDFRDNHNLVALGLPWDATVIPPMADYPPAPAPPGPKRWFYERITNPAVTATPTPFKKDDYILISAGWDGIFGSNDDIFNFDRR